MSDLQFVLDHVEGVAREVDLLDAVDDLLLRLRVDGLLPQLPQLLLVVKKSGVRRGEKEERRVRWRRKQEGEEEGEEVRKIRRLGIR